MHINIAWQDVDTVLLDMGREKRSYATGSDGIYAPAISRRTAYAKLVLS